ncbi:MAG: hypothetical protein A2750_01490 [Candidatus Yanofskybacteria bacterium RIFCSPHIGHO2_01_FULL_45_42]|uniref:Uncharacterized protein n=1 Tax=Candidatus Yanofskybacteria bacterium RIFCSPHIGHO2_01_FULL_45_42 TaxID=1802671 RepID=A0A1F8F776_9BACT|nr:MAG: hypothetical protein A2750_01490 [Candidatus Yanofskybacteria bacterium RIFCSPHIGHO2_01_FULL_45_42]
MRAVFSRGQGLTRYPGEDRVARGILRGQREIGRRKRPLVPDVECCNQLAHSMLSSGAMWTRRFNFQLHWKLCFAGVAFSFPLCYLPKSSLKAEGRLRQMATQGTTP